ncbi:hypothetical protein HDU87_006582 [Geranomyces variabilis]|uniref:C2 domain-containing protein n=1 Tax=Geranomyces variabilis TaxID=109894 RepID=A0AAD5XNU0_9FUNG|nr:hypothetical protein HDU87_006582 [Geranomyces variabilis]
MPCILKVRIVAARNLPVMDRATELTDAFVEVKFADYEEYRTQICKRTLNPMWNEDFRFEVSDDADLQNEPLELKVMDYDQITYNDSIGTVFVDLNPLLTWDSKTQIAGWIPIFDTLRGARGELNVQVRLQFFGDVNPFKDSSAGVQFYTMTSLPPNMNVVGVLGFVSALDNEDDPEYHWSDNFRTPRTSNESRTRVMYRLSGQLRRQLGKKVLELNGNAVIGYKQYFDIESEERAITARAIGTAVRLVLPDLVTLDRGVSWSSMAPHSPNSSPLGGTPFSESVPAVDGPPSTRAGRLLEECTSEDGSSLHVDPTATMLLPTAATGYKSAEHVTFTLHCFPAGAVLGIGGLVSATSVKVIENDKAEVREAWWAELRDEIKTHARALGCPFVIGYSENSSVSNDLAVLHCSGTAAIMDMTMMGSGEGGTGGASQPTSRMNSVFGAWESGKVDRDENLSQSSLSQPRASLTSGDFRDNFMEVFAKRRRRRKRAKGCQACHITYRRDESPFPMSYSKCGLCRKKYVPEVLLTTIDPPSELTTIGNGVLLEAHVCRYRKTHGDSRPSIISEAIPFAQYDIHRQLMYKLRIYGLNAVFGLKLQFSVGESLMTAVATGTAVYVRALPAPPPLKVFRNLDVVDDEDLKLLEIQKRIMASSEENRRKVEMALALVESESGAGASDQQQPSENDPRATLLGDTGSKLAADPDSDSGSDSESDSDDEQEATRRHRSIIVQIDDEQDEDLVLLQTASFPANFQICNTSVPPASDTLFTPSSGLESVQNITMIKHAIISGANHHPNRQLAGLFRMLYEELVLQLSGYFERCVVAGLDYVIQVIKECEVQIVVTGVAMGPLKVVAEEEQDPVIEMSDILEELCGASDTVGSGSQLSLNLGPGRGAEYGPRKVSGAAALPLFAKELSKFSLARELTKLSLGTSTVSFEDDVKYSIDEGSQDGNGGGLKSPLFGVVAGSPMSSAPPGSAVSSRPTQLPNFPSHERTSSAANPSNLLPLEMTPLWYVPSRPTVSHLGRISHHFVKESAMAFDPPQGGTGGFAHLFLYELYAVLRAHAKALGGNAVVGLCVDLCVVEESLKGGTAYALVSVGGDVVILEEEAGKPIESGFVSVGT